MLRKSPADINHQVAREGLVKTLTLYDLLMIGVGGTVGSGIFVLSAQIEAEVTGPGILVSWLIACSVCILSGCSAKSMQMEIHKREQLSLGSF